MWPDRVSNPRPLTYESGAMPTVLRGLANRLLILSLLTLLHSERPKLYTILAILSAIGLTIIPSLPENSNFSTKYFTMSKVYTDKNGIKKLYHSVSSCKGDNSLAKACGLSPHTGRQTMV